MERCVAAAYRRNSKIKMQKSKLQFKIQKFTKILHSRQPRAGFTLIELLVGIAIVGVLSGVLLGVINPAEQIRKSRDAQRKQDLAQIQRSLELYYNDKGTYPPTDSIPFGSEWKDGNTQYMAKVSQDPLPRRTYAYQTESGGYRLFAKLERCSDSQVIDPNPNTCSTAPYNYSVTSPNLSTVAFGGVEPTATQPTPTGGGGGVPTPTPTPASAQCAIGVPVGQTFSDVSMVGCNRSTDFYNAPSYCASNSHVCTLTEYLAKGGATTGAGSSRWLSTESGFSQSCSGCGQTQCTVFPPGTDTGLYGVSNNSTFKFYYGNACSFTNEGWYSNANKGTLMVGVMCCSGSAQTPTVTPTITPSSTPTPTASTPTPTLIPSLCADGTNDQVYSSTMIGCNAGPADGWIVNFSQAAQLCASAAHVCTIDDYLSFGGRTTPSNNNLRWLATKINNNQSACPNSSPPVSLLMRGQSTDSQAFTSAGNGGYAVDTCTNTAYLNPINVSSNVSGTMCCSASAATPTPTPTSSTITAIAYNDTNNNCAPDPGEGNYTGGSATITITDASGTTVVVPTLVGASGTYTSPGLASGTYRTTFGVPPGYQLSSCQAANYVDKTLPPSTTATFNIKPIPTATAAPTARPTPTITPTPVLPTSTPTPTPTVTSTPTPTPSFPFVWQGKTFYKVRVTGTMSDTNVYNACNSAGYVVPCNDVQNGPFSDGLCRDVGFRDGNAPLTTLALALGCIYPGSTSIGCPLVPGTFQYMGQKWGNGDSCGSGPNPWCTHGTTVSNYDALCVSR